MGGRRDIPNGELEEIAGEAIVQARREGADETGQVGGGVRALLERFPGWTASQARHAVMRLRQSGSVTENGPRTSVTDL